MFNASTTRDTPACRRFVVAPSTRTRSVSASRPGMKTKVSTAWSIKSLAQPSDQGTCSHSGLSKNEWRRRNRFKGTCSHVSIWVLAREQLQQALRDSYIEQPDQPQCSKLKNALEGMRPQRLNNGAQAPNVHHPCFGVIPHQKLLVRKQEDQMDHIEATSGVRTRQSLPDGRQDFSASVPPD